MILPSNFEMYEESIFLGHFSFRTCDNYVASKTGKTLNKILNVESQSNVYLSYTAAKIPRLARHVAFHQLKSANVLTVNGIWCRYLLELGNCVASANVWCGPASCCGDCGRILNRVRVEEREQYLMSRRFYHAIPCRALGGNETPLLECLISHARCLSSSAQDRLQARPKILMRQRISL